MKLLLLKVSLTLQVLGNICNGELRGANNNSNIRGSSGDDGTSRKLMSDKGNMNGGGNGSNDWADNTGVTPFENNPGSCVATSLAFQYPDVQSRAGTLLEFEQECGVGGSCFTYDGNPGQGCCRIVSGVSSGGQGNPYECDPNGQMYPYANCICNEHTAPSTSNTPGLVNNPNTPDQPPLDVGVGGGTTPPVSVTPAPGPPANMVASGPPDLVDACQIYNPNNPEFFQGTLNPFFYTGYHPLFKPCFNNADCTELGQPFLNSGGEGCCLVDRCICDTSALVNLGNAQCTG